MAFYRTYRPQVIDEIDNVTVHERLLELLSKPKKDLPHAYLFSGPRGAGKTTAARVIAKLCNCEKPTKTGPCGICEQCTTIAEGRNLDVLEMDAASNRGIDEIRTLREGIALAPVAGRFKIYIIDEVHMLTTEAFNALLKTLEEPPAHAVFVLATTDPQKVPVTIASRCMTFVFTRATIDELTHALNRIVKKEKLAIDNEALTLIAQSVDGSFRDAVKLLEQASFRKGKITAAAIESMLSLATNKTVGEFLEFLRARNSSKALDVIGAMVAKGGDCKLFITQCLQTLEQTLVSQTLGKMKSEWEENDLHTLIRKLTQAYAEMRGSPIAQLPLELVVVEYCSLSSRPPSRDPVLGEKMDPAKRDDNKTSGSLTAEKLAEHWSDVIAELKPYNHSVAGVMRSTRPESVKDGIVTIVAFYTFHRDKLSEAKTRDAIAEVLKKLFGEKVKVEITLGKK